MWLWTSIVIYWFVCLLLCSIVVKVVVFVQEFSCMIHARTTPSVTLACIATREVDVCVRSKKENVVPSMKSAVDNVFAYL